jgi:hypothetical protein
MVWFIRAPFLFSFVVAIPKVYGGVALSWNPLSLIDIPADVLFGMCGLLFPLSIFDSFVRRSKGKRAKPPPAVILPDQDLRARNQFFFSAFVVLAVIVQLGNYKCVELWSNLGTISNIQMLQLVAMSSIAIAFAIASVLLTRWMIITTPVKYE